MRSRALLLVLCAAASSTGCYRYVTRLPGVVDLRTDGEGAERATEVRIDPDTRREGIAALALGGGAELRAGHVSVEERHYWFLGAIPILNTSARDEVAAAVGASGALRRVTIGEEMSAFDAFMAVVGRLLPLAQYVLPSYTFSFSGDAVMAPPRAGSQNAPPPIDDVAPAPLPATPGVDEPPSLLDAPLPPAGAP